MVLGTACAVIAVVVLTWVLGRHHGSVGAALGYGLPVAALYLTFMSVAVRDVRAVMASSDSTGRDLEQEDDDEFAF